MIHEWNWTGGVELDRRFGGTELGRRMEGGRGERRKGSRELDTRYARDSPMGRRDYRKETSSNI
jgi:hypothetical protein